MPLWVIILITVGIVLLLLAVFGLSYVILKKKNKKSLVNAPYISALLLALGGRNNILTVEVEQRRLKIALNNLDTVDFEKLKTFSSSIFVAGNNVKMLFEQNPQAVKEGLLKGGK